jgi:hypothetical protein
VIVRCEIQYPESNLNEKEKVFFFIYFFFRGRYVNLAFLSKMASKYKEGDHLHVSDKVGILYTWEQNGIDLEHVSFWNNAISI